MKEVEPSIPEWFAGRSILITGATGFMGKVLVEKLLRDCPDIERFYLLVRTKKGVDPVQRQDDYIKHLVFENVRKTNPTQMNKIRMIKGDVSVDDMDISENDRNELISNVSVVFHCAANVRFDQPLRDAVNSNTLGTYRMLKLAEMMPHLRVFSHVSTAYCQCKEDVLEERHYPAEHSPLGIAQMTEMLDSDILEYLTPKLLQGLPNTYAYTKGLTEDLIQSFQGKIPIIVTRPSIVTASAREPFPGWIEGLNGPTGLMVGAARGIVRSMHCNPDYPADIIPVDVTTNAIIAATWLRGLQSGTNTDYMNIAVSAEHNWTWGQSIERGREIFYEYPLSYALWYPDGSIKSNYWQHMFCVVFFHYLPAYFIDGMLMLFRKKPFLVRTQNRISMGLNVLQYYTTRRWVFKTDNMKKLKGRLSKEDGATFNFDDDLDWAAYLFDYVNGARVFLLKEGPETLPQSRKFASRLIFLDKCVTFLFYAFIAWLLYSYWSALLYPFESLLNATKSIFIKN